MQKHPDDAWIYETTPENSARFVLGTPGQNPLVCFGINPNTAKPNDLDRTLQLVSRVAEETGHDSFLMFNVCPQRTLTPSEIDRSELHAHKQENEQAIASIIDGRRLTCWAAWGATIGSASALQPLLADILQLPELSNLNWVSRGDLTKGGHPHHPLYVKKHTSLESFDMKNYLRQLQPGSAL